MTTLVLASVVLYPDDWPRLTTTCSTPTLTDYYPTCSTFTETVLCVCGIVFIDLTLPTLNLTHPPKRLVGLVVITTTHLPALLHCIY